MWKKKKKNHINYYGVPAQAGYRLGVGSHIQAWWKILLLDNNEAKARIIRTKETKKGTDPPTRYFAFHLNNLLSNQRNFATSAENTIGHELKKPILLLKNATWFIGFLEEIYHKIISKKIKGNRATICCIFKHVVRIKRVLSSFTNTRITSCTITNDPNPHSIVSQCQLIYMAFVCIYRKLHMYSEKYRKYPKQPSWLDFISPNGSYDSAVNDCNNYISRKLHYVYGKS